MCGIFCILNNGKLVLNETVLDESTIIHSFEQCRGRGPEMSKLVKVDHATTLGFHRLAINGLDEISNQPIVLMGTYLICNGEIYNYKQLYELIPDCTPTTHSDCEVILHLYIRYGIEQTLNMLDGVFSFIIVDTRDTSNSTSSSLVEKQHRLIVARDSYGVRPLYMMNPNPLSKTATSSATNIYGFASELKSLIDMKHILQDADIVQFEPGTFSQFVQRATDVPDASFWEPVTDIQNVPYNRPGFVSQMVYDSMKNYKNNVTLDIQIYLKNAVRKRVMATDRPVACLLSGGLDSSLVTSLVNEIRKEMGEDSPLETYSIGIVGASDLAYARKVAAHLGTRHTEVVLSEQDFFDAIPEVIMKIESYDTTTVRASIGNYLIGKYISEHSEAKVIFNGDGSDELCGGYLYMHAVNDPIEFDKECRRLIKNIYAFDVLRSDKCISTHGLEPRTPFLDRTWVNFYFGIHPAVRCHVLDSEPEKFLLRNAFSSENYRSIIADNESLLPDEILWRTKEAFSDGVSNNARSLFEIIQEKIECSAEINAEINAFDWTSITHNPPATKEQKYYRYLFEKLYRGCGDILPYFWMPKYVNSTDASARTLQLYKDVNSRAKK